MLRKFNRSSRYTTPSWVQVGNPICASPKKNGINGILYLIKVPKLYVLIPIAQAKEIEKVKQNKTKGF